MTNTTLAIELAVENGYEMFGFAKKPLFSYSLSEYWFGTLICIRWAEYGVKSIDNTKRMVDKYHDFDLSCILLDPEFFKALGRGLGWKEHYTKWDGEGEQYRKKWLVEWHSLIDTLANGGTIEEFFTKIMNKEI